MIPSLPEAISATHIEFLPSPPLNLKPLGNSPGNESNRSFNAESFGQSAITEEQFAKLRALHAMQQYAPWNLNRGSIDASLYRGRDLHYAAHVRVPAAQSIGDS